ncbi:MAG: TonB family protein, partial [Cyanobacteria bacterium J06607_15]
ETTPKPESEPAPIPSATQKDTVATNLPPTSQPIPEPETVPPEKPASIDGVSNNASDLLGGDYQKTIASSGDAFFSPEALKYESVLNPEQIKALNGFDLSQYLAAMERRVKPNWNPSSRRDDRRTVLSFNIQPNGQVTGLRVAQSSGSTEVDRESLEAVKKSAPFPPLPADFPLESLEINFSFNIHVY